MQINSKKSRICQVVASINEFVGGPAYSVTNLAQSLSDNDICSHLFTLNYENAGEQVPTTKVKVHTYPATKLAQYLRGFQPSASRALQEIASTDLDLIHNHGLWMFPNLYARQAANKNNLPLVISPRGMLESWSLKNSWFKKLPAWLLYEQKNLQGAVAFHATSDEEVQSIRRLNFCQPVALIPNGVKLPELNNLPAREVLSKQFPRLVDKKWLLFLSRIHPKKGINNLILVWKKLATQFPDWHLVIAGPDLIGYQSKLEKLIADLELQPQVTFTGMLSGSQKAAAMGHADLFVLPTHSENFGIAIAESLAYQVPVITTQGTPWQDLASYQCGWWIENCEQALLDALVDGMEMSDSRRLAMGCHGRNLVETKYSWNVIAQSMARVYSWILYGGTTPNCIQL